MIDLRSVSAPGAPERGVPGDLDVVIIGGGQAGLATGYFLKRHGLRFVILDERERTGDSWRSRWQSLRLFTPARFSSLPGMRFPASPRDFPTRDQMAAYLEAYATHFDLPVLHGVRVDGLLPDGAEGYVAIAGGRRFTAPQVVIATGELSRQRVPGFAGDLDPAIRQINSGEYNHPSQLQDGPVLVVGAGNSGAEIAMEVVREHPTVLAGRYPGQLPAALQGRFGYVIDHGIWFVVHHLLTVRNPIGRKIALEMRLGHSGPVERIRPKELERAGVERIEMRVEGVRDGLPMLADGRALDVANVIWCTGFEPDFSWIRLPVLDEDGYPVHERGVARGVPGLYFVGLSFQSAGSSILVGGVGRDAAYITDRIAARVSVA